jgi:hypothetical protein
VRRFTEEKHYRGKTGMPLPLVIFGEFFTFFGKKSLFFIFFLTRDKGRDIIPQKRLKRGGIES